MKPFTKELKITTVSSESFKQYLLEISKIPILHENEEYEYALKVKEGDENALRILVESNLRFVVSVAKQQVDKYTTLEDLVNEGNIGLIIAAKKYDPSRGFKFISYAVWWVRQRMNEYKNENSRFIRLPNNKLTKINKINTAKTILEQKFNRVPTIDEISEFLKIEDEEVIDMLQLDKNHVNSLDKPMIDEGDSYSLIDITPSLDSVTDNPMENEDREKILSSLLSSLKPREELIIRLCFGLGEHKPLTLQDVGEIVGISREAVRQIRDRSLIRLGSSIRKRKIDISEVLKLG